MQGKCGGGGAGSPAASGMKTGIADDAASLLNGPDDREAVL